MGWRGLQSGPLSRHPRLPRSGIQSHEPSQPSVRPPQVTRGVADRAQAIELCAGTCSRRQFAPDVETASKRLVIAPFDRGFGCIVLAVRGVPASRPHDWPSTPPLSGSVHHVATGHLPIGLVSLGLAALWLTAGPPGRRGQAPSTKNGEWPHYTADVRGTKYSPLDQINADQLQQARSGVAVQDRQPGHAARVQARGHAADDRRRAVHDRRHAASSRGARRQVGRADVGASLSGRQARRLRAPAALRPRRGLLDRRPRRQPRDLRHAWIPADRAQRQDRRA